MTEAREEIAIIGIGCRFPGSANSATEFWALLRAGTDAISDIPAHRANLMDVYDPDPRVPGRSYLRRGGFMDGIDVWDAGFFGVSPREAAHIDPQHRVLLEVAWEAMEDAGQDMEHLAGSRTGVFVGISTHDYGDMQCDPANRNLLDSHSNSGSATSIAANRISYLYDLRGPSFTVDTACSSSLTATHLACRSILAGECDLAIVGGVQMQINPELTIGFCKAAMISPTGQCRAFDASANGYVRSEGAGVVILKRLSAALADGDPVYAVIAGSAINQDGRTIGMTVPSATAQEAMLREALASAQLSATDIHYVEAHGTGTSVGDPLETQALGAVLREGRTGDQRCAIGSVKTNIGHLEAASGMAGLIKTALCVKHRELPASLHFHTPNPDIDFEGGRLRVVTSLEPWPVTDAPATAGVNSFGFGGANAHVILREAPARVDVAAAADGPVIIPLSARSPEALGALAHRMMTTLREGPASLADVASTAAHRRTHHDHRVAVVAATRDDAIEALDAFVAGETRATVASGKRADGAGGLAFVFSGMGPQWWGMGQQLRAQSRVFREMIERCDEALRPHAPWRLIEELSRDEATSRVFEPDLAQVTNFAIQVALAEQLSSWGVVPEAVVGHSAGEMAAAYVAGALSLEHAVKVCYHRSRLQGEAKPGKILAVGLSAERIEAMLGDYGVDVDLAAVNSPVSCTVAGEASAILAMHERLQGEQVFSRLLSFSVAYHSARMDPIRQSLTDVLSDVVARPATIPIISTVSGTWAEGERFNGAYWFENVRRTVRFASAIDTLFDAGHRTFLEVSPHPVLGGSVGEVLASRKTKVAVLASLRRKEDEQVSLLRTLAPLYVQGRQIKWDGVLGGHRAHVALPTYPWQRERHWFDTTPVTTDFTPRVNAAGQHPLLGRQVRAPYPLWESSLGGDRLAWLDDHRIQGTVVFPGAAYVEMALAAAASRPDSTGSISLRNVEFKRALFLSERARTVVQLSTSEAGSRFEVHSAAGDADAPFVQHVTGSFGAHAPAADVDIAVLRAGCPIEGSHDECYAALARRGLEYGPAFRGIEQLWTGNGVALGRIHVPDLNADGYHLHPALLDAAFQLLISAAGDTDAIGTPGVYLPVLVRELTLHSPAGASFWAHATVSSFDEQALVGDIQLFDDDGRAIASTRGFRCQRIEEARGQESLDDWLYEYRWEDRPLDEAHARSVVTLSTDDVAERVQPEADALAAQSGWNAYYAGVEPRLNDITVAYMRRALRGLSDAGIAPARRMLAEHARGVIAAAPGADDADPAVMAADLIRDFPSYATDVALLTRCGTHLLDVLTGRMDPGAVLFGGEAFEMMTRFYREAPPSRYYNTLAASVIAAAGEGRPLRVLELGGGTGGTTAFVLPLLADGSSYTFTDVTPLFTEQARARFADTPAISARTLDIERDPMEQGFAPHAYDIVLGANVLHATASLSESLANVKRLLVPGGALVLIEITRRPVWIDLIFGLTDGWWRFTDRDVRASHPLLRGFEWNALLAREGFNGVAVITDSAHEGEAAQSVIVARAPESIVAPVKVADGDWLAFVDNGGITTSIGQRLGTRVVTVEHGPSFHRSSAEHYSVPLADTNAMRELLGALAMDGIHPRGVLFGWTLDAAEDSAVAPDDLLETQRIGIGSALALVQALVARSESMPELCIVTAGAQQVDAHERVATTQSPVWGFGRVITKEQPGLRTRLVDIGADRTVADVDALARELAAGEWEDELSLRHGTRRVRRLHRVLRSDAIMSEAGHPASPGEAYRADVSTAGALETLALRSAERRAPSAGDVEIQVAAASMNFRDVMIAMGLYPTIAGEASFGRGLLGLDCAGTVSACGSGVTEFSVGDEVVGIGAGTFGSYVTTRASLVTRRPAMLSVTEGAAVPSVFVTAYYSLIHLARLQPGERVLIHSATGGVGLAAIQVAREAGAEIFATAGSEEKRAYLRALGITHVMDSRSLQFADDVMVATNGEGVDVVLNSLAGEAIARGIGVLRSYGRFVEIGKRDIFQDSRIGLLAFRKNLAFFGVDVDKLSLDRPELAREMLHAIVERFDRGAYTALPEVVFPVSRVEDAMRFMAQAKHIGKVIVSMKDDDVQVVPAGANTPLFREDATYLISGGLGGFGLAVAEWMAREGARTIVLTGRSGAVGEAEERVRQLREQGVRVEVARSDIASAVDVRRMLGDIRNCMPPLRGVIHAAMVLDDASLVELDGARLDTVMAPKMRGAWHLHRETLSDPLDHFVMFSSLTSMFGNPLQANYAAANAYLDALAHDRHAQKRPALAVNWGPLAQVGYVSRHRDVADYLERQGYHAFAPAQAFEILGTLMRREAAQVMAARIDWARWSESSPTAAASAMLRHFAPSAQAGAARRAEGGSALAAIMAAPAAERREAFEQFLREKAGKVLGASPKKFDVDRPLTEMGLDSLIAVELMTVLRVELGVELAAVKLLQGASISAIATMVLEQLGEDGAAPAERVERVVSVSEPAIVPPLQVVEVVDDADAAQAVEAVSAAHMAVPALRNTSAVAPNGKSSRYATIDYSRWSTGQQAIRGLTALGLRMITKMDVDGVANIPRDGGCLLAINHLSFADTPVVLSLLPRRTIMFASEHLRSSAFMNWVLSDMGDAIYVRRGEGDTDALASGLAVLRAGGMLGLGPEGTRSPGGLTRGHTGVAYLATQAGVPVIPLAAWGQEHIPTHLRSRRRAPITVRIGAPLTFNDPTPTAARLRSYTDQVMTAIAGMLPDGYRGVYGSNTESASLRTG